MEKIHEALLAALRCALRGEQADTDLLPEDWAALLRLADAHKVLPMILDAVHGCPSLQGLGEGPLLLVKRQVRRQVMVQTLRTGEFLTLNRALRDRGLRPLVVKGLVCRELYLKPDHRPSGDEDVLIDPKQFDRCREILLEQGLESLGEEPDAYEIPFRKPGGYLYMELHRSLFPPQSDAYGHWNRFFDGVFDRAVELELRDSRVLTPAPTDHLFFLLCHAFKHFLHGGFGIRQVCDLALFAEAYGEEVDWQRVLDNCAAIRGVKFAAAIFRIGEKHLGIPAPAAFRAVTVDEEPMLTDLLLGGLYGDATLSRKHSSTITLEAVAAEKQGRRSRGGLMASAFPSAEKLAGKYPYLKKNPWLLPLAWGQRLWRYSRETRTAADSSAAEALKLGRERLALLRQYDILD